jgi:hypothetical protein
MPDFVSFRLATDGGAADTGGGLSRRLRLKK